MNIQAEVRPHNTDYVPHDTLVCPKCGGEMREDPEFRSMLVAVRVYVCQQCGIQEWVINGKV